MTPLFSSWRKQTNAALKWAALVIPMAMAVGSACAFFLWSLDAVTSLRFQQPWLLYLLPVAGVAVGSVYHRWGKSAERGSNLIMDEIHRPGGGVPRRMAPLVLFGTLVTHLFGGEHIVYLATACFIAYRCSGHSGIYLSQRVARSKGGSDASNPDPTLREIRGKSPAATGRAHTL